MDIFGGHYSGYHRLSDFELEANKSKNQGYRGSMPGVRGNPRCVTIKCPRVATAPSVSTHSRASGADAHRTQ